MKRKATVVLFVQDHRLVPYTTADVRVRELDGDEWQRVPYNKEKQRYVAHLRPGRYRLKVRGEGDWSVDARSVILHAGENTLFSTLAPEGTPYYVGVDGEKTYFEPDESRLLLYAQGKEVHEILPKLMEEAGLKLGKALLAPGQKPQPDNAAFEVFLPEPAEERKGVLARLDSLVTEMLPGAGLRGQLAAPMLRGETVVEGLTNQLVVRFQPSVTEEDAQRIADEHGFRVVRRVLYLGNAYLWERGAIPEYELLKVAQDLMARYPILYAEPNILIQIEDDVFNPDDYLYPEQPHYQVIHADDAWDTLDDIHVNLRFGSPNVTVAIFDSNGVSPNHPDLTGNLTDGTAKMVANFDFVNWVPQAVGGLSGEHGTQCASSAVGRTHNGIGAAGLAGNCHLIGARRGGAAAVVDIVDGWIWAAGFPTGSLNPAFPAQLATGADIIANSWGGGFAWSNTLRDGLDFLTVYGRGGKGCIVCFSVGNLGYRSFSAERRMASYERTIAVGATINLNPTNPCNSSQADPAGNLNNLPAVVDTRTYYNPFGPEMDIVAPSHTCYDPALPGARIRDPIMAAARVNEGDWPGDSVAQTTTTFAEAAGNTLIQVVSSAGFAVGEFALFGGPGATPNETKQITAVGPGQINVLALENAYPAGTIVATGPNDYAMNPNVGFGGTSHSCPTVAGAAALILSVRPELTWVQVREILRTTADRVDVGQANPTGQWVDNDGDGVDEFSQWYGYGRLNANEAVIEARDLDHVPDVVVRDNLDDDGSVPSDGWHADSPDIWVRRTDDPIPVLAYDAAPLHQHPLRGQDNYVYMRVKNFGDAPTHEVYLRLLITHFPGFEFRYPQEWQPSTRPGDPVPSPLVPGTYLIGEERIDELAADANIIVKMTWDEDLIPPANVLVDGVNVQWHPCLLAEVSPHDGPAPAGATFDVKRDNNLAHKNIRIEDPEDDGDAFAAGIAAGTSYAEGISSVIVDPSQLPSEYKVFIRIPRQKIMDRWMELAKAGKLVASKPLPRLKKEVPWPEPDWPIGPIGPVDWVALDTYQDRDVILVRGGSPALEFPLRLAADDFVPIVLGIIRPEGERGKGTLMATQRRGDGELSPGYSIEG